MFSKNPPNISIWNIFQGKEKKDDGRARREGRGPRGEEGGSQEAAPLQVHQEGRQAFSFSGHNFIYENIYLEAELYNSCLANF